MKLKSITNSLTILLVLATSLGAGVTQGKQLNLGAKTAIAKNIENTRQDAVTKIEAILNLLVKANALLTPEE
jgi:hypothetical protein